MPKHAQIAAGPGMFALACLVLLGVIASTNARANELTVERVTSIAPYPRGLVAVDGKLYVLCRGRVRGSGGVSSEVDDQAGRIYVVDPNIAQNISEADVAPRIAANGSLFAEPTDPPFNLFDRSLVNPERDRYTDRPYCTLRFDAATQSFYLCAFSGIDKPKRPGQSSFSKNLTDALLRYDLRTKQWHEVERHNIEAGGSYPHHDPQTQAPPHGWLNGPDNCLVLGRWLFAVGKDNSILARYDLSKLRDDPHAGAPQSQVILADTVAVGGKTMRYYGQSALAYFDGYLYIAYRTSSVIIRIPLDTQYNPLEPIAAELVAQFDPYDPHTDHSANLTDMDFDEQGRLYVVSAKPSRLFRFTPNPRRVFDGRTGSSAPWADLANLTGNPKMKSENVLIYNGYAYVTSGDGYNAYTGNAGMVYRVRIGD